MGFNTRQLHDFVPPHPARKSAVGESAVRLFNRFDEIPNEADITLGAIGPTVAEVPRACEIEESVAHGSGLVAFIKRAADLAEAVSEGKRADNCGVCAPAK